MKMLALVVSIESGKVLKGVASEEWRNLSHVQGNGNAENIYSKCRRISCYR